MRNRWWVLTAVGCGTFMSTLDSSMMNIALPTLRREMSTSLEEIKFVVIAHLLVVTCLLLPAGRMANLLGRKRIILFGFLIFALASALATLAPSLPLLILARIFQGVGSAMLMANGPAIITEAFQEDGDLGKALGTLSMVASIGLISGPAIGGYIITSLGWRALFWTYVPVAILGFILALTRIPKDRIEARKDARFDWLGAILQAFSLVALIFLFDPPNIRSQNSEFWTWHRLILLATFLIAVFSFVRLQIKSPSPLVDLGILRIRNFLVGNVTAFLMFLSFSVVTVLTPFFLEDSLHFNTRQTGMYMTLIPVAVFIFAPLAGRLSDRFGGNILSAIGLATGSLSLFWMAYCFLHHDPNDSTQIGLLAGLFGSGVALGIFQAPNNRSIMNSVPREKIGDASALLATVRSLGLVVGTGLAATMFILEYEIFGNPGQAMNLTFIAAGVIAISSTIISLIRQIK